MQTSWVITVNDVFQAKARNKHWYDMATANRELSVDQLVLIDISVDANLYGPL